MRKVRGHRGCARRLTEHGGHGVESTVTPQVIRSVEFAVSDGCLGLDGGLPFFNAPSCLRPSDGTQRFALCGFACGGQQPPVG